MPVRLPYTSGEGWSQAKNRVRKIFFDQHRNTQAGFPNGRPWWCWCEKQVDGSDAAPVGELSPVSADISVDGETIKGWDAPWVPESKYILMAVSGLQGARFKIDYQRMRKEYEDANRAYYDLVNNEAFNKGWDPVPLYAQVPYVIRALKHIGAPPKSPKIPEAALGGDRWLLGFSREPNEALQNILAMDNGRMAITPGEFTTAQTAKPAESSEFTDEEIAAAVKALKQVKQAELMRAAKAKKGEKSPAADEEQAA